MPKYNAGGNGYSGAIALTPGDTVALVNDATTDSGVTKSQQVHIGPSATASGTRVTVTNTSNQSASIYVTTIADVLANYVPFDVTDPATGSSNAIAVANGTSLSFDPGACWILASFGTAPTSGSVVISR